MHDVSAHDYEAIKDLKSVFLYNQLNGRIVSSVRRTVKCFSPRRVSTDGLLLMLSTADARADTSHHLILILSHDVEPHFPLSLK